MIPSMSRPANPYDNASCESFLKTLKREEIYANEYRDLEHLRANIQEFIEQYYNRCRLHSALGYRPPEEFEQAAQVEATSAGGGCRSVIAFCSAAIGNRAASVRSNSQVRRVHVRNGAERVQVPSAIEVSSAWVVATDSSNQLPPCGSDSLGWAFRGPTTFCVHAVCAARHTS